MTDKRKRSEQEWLKPPFKIEVSASHIERGLVSISLLGMQGKIKRGYGVDITPAEARKLAENLNYYADLTQKIKAAMAEQPNADFVKVKIDG